jgi:hypothetical protein
MGRLKQDVAGNAGVMFVAGELGRRGLIALPTVRNTAGVDVIASEPMDGRSVKIQVKTTQQYKKRWVLTTKNEKLESDTFFYVFVNLGLPGELPEYHIVPGAVVAKTIREGHAAWVATPGRGGRPHGHSDVRVFVDVQSRYRDNWDALGLRMTK